MFFRNAELIKFIGRGSFWITGMTPENKRFNELKKENILPLAICLSENIYEELVEVGREFLPNVGYEVLNRWAHESRNLYRRDNNILVKYRNLVARAHGIYLEESE